MDKIDMKLKASENCYRSDASLVYNPPRELQVRISNFSFLNFPPIFLNLMLKIVKTVLTTPTVYCVGWGEKTEKNTI